MSNVVTSRDGEFFVITLANPAKRNSLGIETLREITDALHDAGKSDAIGVIVRADGPVFSAGHNFGEMAGATEQQARELFDVCAAMMHTIQSIPQPVIARVHALATAAGCQLVASCDLAVAAESASFAIPGGKGGLFCHTPLVAVARNIGRKRALEMAMTGDAIDAHTAAQWGLINKAVPDDQLDDAVHDLLGRACRGSLWSKAVGKHAFYAQIDMSQPDAYIYASEVMARAVAGADAQEGIDAFLNKRAPVFTERPTTGE